ncbi:hypothetical protein [Desulfosporosinus metallidurans]|uniref:Uncharacterized protein n=1 Tax=Desulfosporosinus metallidurans TaxID=1888891 RepID=A0A1Q8QEL0_9FIRM|nr:hypothetical protein [Desulfosporosinus metallidurans]OLN25787.1 hypothetical protein DSOL_5231 [Desulfosporosinus metallidurans]
MLYDMNKTVVFDEQTEAIRIQLKDYIINNGVRQNFVAGYCDLSECSISMFLHGKRILADVKLDIIKALVSKVR